MKKTMSVGWLLLALSACAPQCGGTEIPEACNQNGVTPNDPIICPRISPIVLEPILPGERGTFAFEVNNYSSSAQLEITSVRFEGGRTDVFTNPQVSPTTVEPQDVAVVQFSYQQSDLTEKRSTLIIESNAKNFSRLEIETVIREGVLRDADGGVTDGGS